jgi:membrane associated rhomboid family serine protease
MIQLTPAVKNLLIINVVVFIILQLPLGQMLYSYFLLNKTGLIFSLPEGLDGLFQPVQLVTYFFNHADIFHILFNLMALGSIGPMVEYQLGSMRFLKFYLFTGLFGGILIALLDPTPNPVLGASVAVFGVLVAFAMIYPRNKLGMFFLPIFIEARYLVAGLGVLSLVFVIQDFTGGSGGGNISHFGHLAGMVAAILFFFLEKHVPFFRNWPPVR